MPPLPAPAPAGLTGAPERVRLTVPGVGAVDAVVVRAVPGAAELLLTGPPPAPARVLHRRPARIASLPPAPPDVLPATLLAVPDAHGALRADLVLALFAIRPGDAAPAPADPAAAGGADDAPAGAPDRRAAIRVPVLRAVSIHHPGVVTGIQARTQDVSAAGLSLRGTSALVLGDLVRLRLMLDREHPLDAVGEVRRRAGADHHGVQLVRMRPQDRIWLQRWLAAQQQAPAAPAGPDVLAYGS